MSGPTRRIVHRGAKIDLAIQQIRLADGSTADREVILHRGAVALLPFVDPDHYCLIRNHRFAIDSTILEIPAGTIDEGETPEATAARELVEETGYTAGRITLWKSWWVSPGVMNERMHLFACDDLTPGATAHQPDEAIEPVVVSRAEARRMIDDGRIQDAKSILSILLAEQIRPT